MRRERFTQAREFEVTYGGGECNVAVSLAQFGVDATFVTAIPDNDIGQSCINYIRQFGVDTSEILRQGQRLGTYYLESGAAMRASKVVYDRAASSIAEIQPGDVDWAKVFDGADWFHFTGITPAISKNAGHCFGRHELS
jgi:2-dehydro-3-deoxygluconokinase